MKPHTQIRAVTLTAAYTHDRQDFKNVVSGDEEMVMADKAYWSQARSEWCGKTAWLTEFCASPT